MTRRLSRTAVVASAAAALVATSNAFTLGSLPSSSAMSSPSSGRRCVRGRACSASQQPSMVASVPRTVVETGTDTARKQRLHVQVRACGGGCVMCLLVLCSNRTLIRQYSTAALLAV